jgi:3-methyladenine DNA glycosylase AlkD
MAMLEARKDPGYEAGMRRTVPSDQPAHAVRVPEVRRLAREWLRSHPDLSLEQLFWLCEALWQTGWREERLLSLDLIKQHPDAIYEVDFEWTRRWSAEVDNWEVIDHMSEISGRLLQMQPRLLNRVEQLIYSDSPWQRRFALVTLIMAARDFAWRPALERMAERMAKDPHPSVRRAVVWARRELKKPEGSLV